MFAIEPDSFNSYSCSALTEVNNPLYMIAKLPSMMLVLNMDFFRNTSMWGLFEQRTNQMWLDRLFRLTPQNIWYIRHCSDTPNPMFELPPRVGFVRTMNNLTLTCFYDSTLFSI